MDTHLQQVLALLILIEKNQHRVVPQVNSILLDKQDVMQKLHISESTLKRRRSDGTLKGTLIKGKYYYSEADIGELFR